MSSSAPSPLNSQAHNALLAFFAADMKAGAKLPPERRLAERAETSRTTIRRILHTLERKGLIRRSSTGLLLARKPRTQDYLPQSKILSRREGVEQSLVDMLIRGQLKPGEYFSELALAKEHGVTTGTVREALIGLSRLGVFSKQARKRWQVVEIDRAMIHELMDLRTLLELFALKQYLLRPERTLQRAFQKIHRELKNLIRSTRLERAAFFRLDGQLHATILQGASNRYLRDYSRHIFFPIELQFLHHGFEEKAFRLGISQHLSILESIERGDVKKALTSLEHHLTSARRTLLDLCKKTGVASP